MGIGMHGAYFVHTPNFNNVKMQWGTEADWLFKPALHANLAGRPNQLWRNYRKSGDPCKKFLSTARPP